MGKVEAERSIPTIDLQEHPFPYAKLREACEEWGCFRVVNHGVPRKLMSEMKTLSRSVLDLPVEIKMRNTCPSPGTGYIGTNQLANVICESLGLSPNCPEDIHTFCSQLDLSSDQRATIEIYSRATCEVMGDIANKMATSLGVEGQKDLFKNWFRHMRMNKYDFTPETIGFTGLGSHIDISFITLVQEDEHVGGLQVEDKTSGRFVAVEPASPPDSLLVNLGDMAVVWSNGRFTGVKHRVDCMDGSVRVSIATFLTAPRESPIEAPEQLVDSQHPRLYTPIDFKQYAQLRATNRTVNGETLLFFRIVN